MNKEIYDNVYDGIRAVDGEHEKLKRKFKRERIMFLSLICAGLLAAVAMFFACDMHPTGGGDEAMMNVSSLEVFPISIDGGVVRDIEGNEIEPILNDFQNVKVQFTPEPGVNTIGITIDGSMSIDIEILPGPVANGVN